MLGFYGVFVGLQFKYAQEANNSFDRDQYSAADEMTFKVPLAVPYSTDQEEYQRVNGEFEHDGEVYRLVKQKLVHDTLYVVCVKDVRSGTINRALADYVKTFTDKPANSKQHNGKTALSFVKEYVSTGVSVQSLTSGWDKPVTYGEFVAKYLSIHTSRIKYPPRFI